LIELRDINREYRGKTEEPSKKKEKKQRKNSEKQRKQEKTEQKQTGVKSKHGLGAVARRIVRSYKPALDPGYIAPDG